MRAKHASKGTRNIFSGPTAVIDFLNPGNAQYMPLVELGGEFNPFMADKVRIFAKIGYLNPLFNIKALPAFMMLQRAQQAGKLKGVKTLVEASSGNTASALAILARQFGIKRTDVILPNDIAPDKREMCHLSGANLSLLPRGAIAEARKRGKKRGCWNPDQYANPDNPLAFETWLGPEIWEQTRGMITIFCVGLGTTGTLVGARKFFHQQHLKGAPRVYTLGVACEEGNPVPGVRDAERLGEVGFNWKGAMYMYTEATRIEAYRWSLKLWRHGVLAGPSSGLALSGLVSMLKTQVGYLNPFRNKKGEVLAVFVCPDTPLPYLGKYSTILDPEDIAPPG